MGAENTGGRWAGRAAAWILLLAIAWPDPAGAQESGSPSRIAVDRWLVSSPLTVPGDEDPLTTDLLSAPGEIAVLPDRGRTLAGADWTLVRRDSAFAIELEGGGSEGVVVYAHAYLRSDRDRSVRLEWGGIDCTEVNAWLNGRSLAELGRADATDEDSVGPFHALVRIGYGYNTLLLKAVSGDCTFGVTASIQPATPSGSLQGLRVQASRPYGDTRTGPAPWVLAEPDAGPEPILGWKEDELFGAAGVRLAAFAVTAVEGAKLKAKIDGEGVERRVEWLTPAEPETILMPFPFKTLREALVRGVGMEIELDWDEDESRSILGLDPEALLEALHSPIRLLGWTGPATEIPNDPEAGADLRDADGEPHPLAHLIPLPGAGVTLVGEWKVPGWLSGFDLELDVSGAPGEYRLDSRPIEGDRIPLCQDCRKNSLVQLVVQTTGEWQRFPAVLLAGPRPVAQGAVEAAGWLRLLDEKGSREYRQRLESAP